MPGHLMEQKIRSNRYLLILKHHPHHQLGQCGDLLLRTAVQEPVVLDTQGIGERGAAGEPGKCLGQDAAANHIHQPAIDSPYLSDSGI